MFLGRPREQWALGALSERMNFIQLVCCAFIPLTRQQWWVPLMPPSLRLFFRGPPSINDTSQISHYMSKPLTTSSPPTMHRKQLSISWNMNLSPVHTVHYVRLMYCFSRWEWHQGTCAAPITADGWVFPMWNDWQCSHYVYIVSSYTHSFRDLVCPLRFPPRNVQISLLLCTD